MKIIIINGSSRANGATGQILTKISETIANIDSSVEIDYVDLSKMDLMFCTGCASCYSTGVCPIQDDGVEELSHKIAMCDGVIFGSPTFVCNVSGRFKVLIDRGHFVFEQLLKNKACFSVVTYENYGGKHVKKIINELIRFSGGAVSCEYIVKLNPNDKALNSDRNSQIEKLCSKFLIKAKQENPLSIYEKILGSAVFHFGIKPHAFRNELRFKGVISRWAKQGLISTLRAQSCNK